MNQQQQETNQTNIGFCVICSKVRFTEKGKCLHCHNRMKSPQIESPMTPQIEGSKPYKSRPSSPCYTQYSEGITNDEPLRIDDISFSSDEYDDDADYRELMCLEADDIKSNSYQTSSSRLSPPPPSPISSKKSRNRNRNRNKYKRSRRNKRKSNHNHYNNHNHHRIKKMKKEIIDITASDNNYSMASHKNSPLIIIDDNDSDEDVQIIPDFPSPTPSINAKSSHSSYHSSSHSSSYNFDDTISTISNQSSSPSLSICSGVGRMTITLQDDSPIQNRYNRPTRKDPPRCQDPLLSKHEEVMAAWREQINPKETTLKGLELIHSLKMPRKECKALIELIREGFKHIIGASIPYQDRLIAMIVGLLEVIKLEQYTGNPCNNWLNSSNKPQILLIAPKRHAALEAKKMFVQIGTFYELYTEALIGGMPSYQCAQRLRGGIDVICGTPGKLMDMVQRGALNKNKLSNLVAFAMDGADELIQSQSMKKQMRIITEAFPDRRVRVLWLESVTTNYNKQNAERYIHGIDPTMNTNADERNMINCMAPSITNNSDDIGRMIHIKKITHNEEEWTKRDALEDILRCYSHHNSIIIFFNTRRGLRRNWDILMNSRNLVISRSKMYFMDGLCNNMERRETISNMVEYGGILLCTDIMSSGITMDRCSIIINFDVPYDVIKYIQRAGVAIGNKRDNVYIVSIVNGRDRKRMSGNNDIENIQRISDELKIKMVDYRWCSASRHRY